MSGQISIAQLLAAGVELEHQAANAKAAIHAALLAGSDTAPHRTRLAKIAADISGQAAQIARLRAETEAASAQSFQSAAADITRASMERLRFTLATVAAPRPPKPLRGGA